MGHHLTKKITNIFNDSIPKKAYSVVVAWQDLTRIRKQVHVDVWTNGSIYKYTRLYNSKDASHVNVKITNVLVDVEKFVDASRGGDSDMEEVEEIFDINIGSEEINVMIH